MNSHHDIPHFTPDQERQSIHVSSAMADYARRHSAALVFIYAQDHVDLGSATCVMLGGRYFLATAGHNLSAESEAESIWIAPYQATTSERIPVLDTGWREDSVYDVGWIELDRERAIESNLQFIGIDDLGPGEVPTESSLYLLQGLPAQLASVETKTIKVASLGYMTIPVGSDGPGAVEQAKQELVMEYGPGADQPLPMPKGMSGGGLWSIPNEDDRAVWAPSKSKLVGIIRAWREQSQQLLANRIDCWIDLLVEDHPDLRSIVGKWR